ncbi:hypothetical protein NE237_011553 [Protea cynaroides]|uniref:Uncharacterized protein n=1 Tax=Protea cynaroides TaxID=273540 RepID=A0A9Q0JY12_9MAGN|nr:hypothetical protein NE237_011553 [Protea cynaroides]
MSLLQLQYCSSKFGEKLWNTQILERVFGIKVSTMPAGSSLPSVPVFLLVGRGAGYGQGSGVSRVEDQGCMNLNQVTSVSPAVSGFVTAQALGIAARSGGALPSSGTSGLSVPMLIMDMHVGGPQVCAVVEAFPSLSHVAANVGRAVCSRLLLGRWWIWVNFWGYRMRRCLIAGLQMLWEILGMLFILIL